MKRIAILGSTGSIGRSTLSVVESYPERFSVAALAADGPCTIEGAEAARVSFPEFFDTLHRVAG